MTGLRRALLGLGLVGLAFGLAFIGLHLTSRHDMTEPAVAAMETLVGFAFLATGLFAWLRRPDNRVGALMTFTGIVWFLQGLELSDQAGFHTAGLLLGFLCVPIAFGLLSFPTGRLERRLERWIVAGAWVWATAVTLVVVLLSPTDPAADAPENLLAVVQGQAAGDVAEIVFVCIAGVLALALAGDLADRWRVSTPIQRREMAPFFVPGLAAAVLLPVQLGLDAAGAPGGVVTAAHVVGLLALAGLPFGFLVGLVRARVVAGRAVGEIVERLGAEPGPVGLRDLLSEALRDPSLELAYWIPERGGYVDARGRPAVLPDAGADRAWTPVEHDGRPVAAILHDAALGREPDAVRAAGTAAALALENARLEAELRSRVQELRASRARIIAAEDDERRRLERDLHDGAQQRLVSLALRLRLARNRLDDAAPAAQLLDGAMTELREALDELRELARGIHPAILTERGLGAALEALAGRAPLPVEVRIEDDDALPRPVAAAAYFVVAEALTNVAKYASASQASVRVARDNGLAVVEVRDDGVGGADEAAGSGLRGLADRVGALDGRLRVDSPAGAGTCVRAEIPCAS